MPFAKGAVSDGVGVSVDAWRLLRLVRLRRALRLLCLLAVLAVPVWAALTIAAESLLPRTSSTFWAIDATVGPGFLIILAVLAGAFALLAGSGLLGRAGRTAAELAPVFGRANFDKVDAAPQAERLYWLLSPQRNVRALAAMLFVLVGMAGAFTGRNVWPAWQADHGHGGPVVTIGSTANIAYSTVGSHGRRDYFLSTPYGTAIAEDYQPHDGQRWTVLPSSIGNGEAYLIGGHDYLLVGVLTLGFAVAEILTGALLITRALAWLRARRAARAAGTLADSVDYLSGGNPVRLRIAARRPVTVELTLRSTGGRSGRAWLARRRRIALALTIAVAGAASTVTGLWAAGVFRSPPAQRDLTLAFLRQTSWEPDVTINYKQNGSATTVLRDGLRDVGAPSRGATVTASVMVSSHQVGVGDAWVDVANIAPVKPSTAVRSVMAFERIVGASPDSAVTPVTGLPPGWQGVSVTTRGKASEADIEIAGGAGGQLLQISLYGDYGSARYLTHVGSELAREISGWGIARFASATAR